jgi:hypothetical protein
MNRKVIFVPDDYWTNPPKENTVNINPAVAGDLRRAAAFIKHHAYSDREGMNAILTEAIDTHRAGEFIEGILVTFDAVVPQLITPAGRRCMADMILTYAGDSTLTEGSNRAARFLVAYGLVDRGQMNNIIRETDDVSPTIIALADIYATILPTLYTPTGLEVLDRGIHTLAAKEAEGDR